MNTSEARFLRSAQLCRIRDLEQQVVLGELIQGLNELIHVLQKERGTSAIFLGSYGARFVEPLSQRVQESRGLELAVRVRFENADQWLDRGISSARFYTRVALALRALETLSGLREQVATLTLAPQDAVTSFTEIIGSLIAVGFEVADMPADPGVSRALIALVNCAQAKEYAGQERAITGAALSSGQFHAADQRRLRQLAAAQEQALHISMEFSDPSRIAGFKELLTGADSAELKRVRQILASNRDGKAVPVTADTWFHLTTRRIDAMKAMEDRIAAALARLCATRLTEVRDSPHSIETDRAEAISHDATFAMLATDVDPAQNLLGLGPGVSLYTLAGAQPQRSILEVIQAQSRHIHDVSNQLESARSALAERKIIERAKGIVMDSRRLSENDAYALIRESAMSQNKRIAEIAEAIVSMTDMLKK